MSYNFNYHSSRINVNTEKIFFNGYASVFNVIDSYGDITTEETFIDDVSANSPITLLWQHDEKTPIGLITKLSLDENGLFVYGYILKSTHYGQETISLIENNVVTGLSVGMFVIDTAIIDDVRYITKATLREISVVTFPANTSTIIKIIGHGV